MNTAIITATGIDASKYKSTAAARRPGGELVKSPPRVHVNLQIVM